jgi:hypothetical protein
VNEVDTGRKNIVERFPIRLMPGRVRSSLVISLARRRNPDNETASFCRFFEFDSESTSKKQIWHYMNVFHSSSIK